MIDVVHAGSQRNGDLGRLGTLKVQSPTELRWEVDRHVELLHFENGMADWQCAIALDQKAGVVATHYSPEVYSLDAESPPETRRLLTIPRAGVDAGLRRLRLIPLGTSVLLVYELGLARVKRCRHVEWWRTHWRFELTLVSADEEWVRLEDQEGHEFVFSSSNGRVMT